MGTKLFNAGREAFLNGLKAAHLAELSDKMNISIQAAGDAVSKFADSLPDAGLSEPRQWQVAILAPPPG